MSQFLFLSRRDDAAWRAPCEKEQHPQGQKGACSGCRNLKHYGYISSRKDFVVHISDETQLDAVNQSSAALDHGVSEVNELGLPLSDFDGFSLPRLTDCAIAFGCRLHRLDEIGNAPQAVIYGEIQTMYVDDRVLLPDDSGKLVIDPRKMKPLARLGGADYSTLGDLLSAKRPT